MRRRNGRLCARCLLNATQTVRVQSPACRVRPRFTDAIPLDLCEMHAHAVMWSARRDGWLATSRPVAA